MINITILPNRWQPNVSTGASRSDLISRIPKKQHQSVMTNNKSVDKESYRFSDNSPFITKTSITINICYNFCC